MNEQNVFSSVKDYICYLMESGVEGLRIREPSSLDMEKRNEPKSESPARQETLSDVRTELGDCKRCPLSRIRTNIVFGEG
ncbi:MAG: hypothetical protein ACWGQW_22825, partial [bacterium]